MIEICYCIDENTETCAFVSIFSLLKHSKTKLLINVLIENDKPYLAAKWKNKLKKYDFEFEIKRHPVDIYKFKICRSMYGSYAPYLLFYAPFWFFTEFCG